MTARTQPGSHKITCPRRQRAATGSSYFSPIDGAPQRLLGGMHVPLDIATLVVMQLLFYHCHGSCLRTARCQCEAYDGRTQCVCDMRVSCVSMVFQADRSSHQEHLQVAASSTQLCRKANPTFNAVPPSLPGRSMHIYIQFEMFGFGAFLYVDLP